MTGDGTDSDPSTARRTSGPTRYGCVPHGPDAVTVVVATRDRPQRLERCLDELRRGNPRSPVIVCDDASTGGATAEVALRHGAGLVTLARSVGAAARNAGVREARTPLVALCDDDAWWAPRGPRHGG